MGSGLRLCVKHGLLQACVLLATQDDNSRIHWSVSQECEHVLSSDMKPYNKKLLGTSPVLIQEVTLPANFMLRNVSCSFENFTTQEHMFTIVRYGLRPNASKHHIRVCACLTAHFDFFSRAASGVLLTVINAQVSDTTLSIIRQSRMSYTIKLHPLRECLQL